MVHSGAIFDTYRNPGDPTLSIIPNRRMDGRFPRLLYRRQGDFFPGSVVSVTILPATMDGQQMGDRISSPHLGPDRQTNMEIFCNRLLTQMCMPEVDKSPCASCACMAFRTICHICSILQCAVFLLFHSCRLRQLQQISNMAPRSLLHMRRSRTDYCRGVT